MSKALFLDRDGVINREHGDYTYRLQDFQILPDVHESLELASEKGYKLIVISNQGGIAKGVYTKRDVDLLHDFLRQELSKIGVELTEIYYCPHHESVGNCICRKPDSLMLEKAVARFGIDVDASVFIGDSERDIQAASKMGIQGVLIESNTSILHIVTELE